MLARQVFSKDDFMSQTQANLVEVRGIRFSRGDRVIFDDISLDVGKMRIRRKGSDGGHNGIKSIIYLTGSDQFPRIKVGVGAKPPKMDLADYVLSRFGAEEQKIMDEAFGEAAEAAVMMMTTGAERAMNHYNAKKKAE